MKKLTGSQNKLKTEKNDLHSSTIVYQLRSIDELRYKKWFKELKRIKEQEAAESELITAVPTASKRSRTLITVTISDIIRARTEHRQLLREQKLLEKKKNDQSEQWRQDLPSTIPRCDIVLDHEY